MTSVGLIFSNTLISCSNTGISLEKCIGQSEDLLSSFPKEGDHNFAYYTLNESDFIHPLIFGETTYVFSQEGKIVGYTIKMSGISEITKYSNKLNELYGPSIKIFENDYGEEHKWTTPDRNMILNYTKQYKNIPQNTFYSEALKGNKLIVF